MISTRMCGHSHSVTRQVMACGSSSRVLASSCSRTSSATHSASGVSVMTSGWKERRALGKPLNEEGCQPVDTLPSAGGDGEVLDVGQPVRPGQPLNGRLGLEEPFHHLRIVGLVGLVHHDDEAGGLTDLISVVFVFLVVVVEGVTRGVGSDRAALSSASSPDLRPGGCRGCRDPLYLAHGSLQHRPVPRPNGCRAVDDHQNDVDVFQGVGGRLVQPAPERAPGSVDAGCVDEDHLGIGCRVVQDARGSGGVSCWAVTR